MSFDHPSKMFCKNNELPSGFSSVSELPGALARVVWVSSDATPAYHGAVDMTNRQGLRRVTVPDLQEVEMTLADGTLVCSGVVSGMGVAQ